jgi:hypothetical protein
VASFSFPLHSKKARSSKARETHRSSLATTCFNACTVTTSVSGERQGCIVKTEEFWELIESALVGVHHVNAREGDVLEPQERPWLDEVVLNGVAGCGGPGGDPELGIDRTHMCIDRRKTDHQLLGNLDVGLPHCQQAQDLVLAPGQSSR